MIGMWDNPPAPPRIRQQDQPTTLVRTDHGSSGSQPMCTAAQTGAPERCRARPRSSTTSSIPRPRQGVLRPQRRASAGPVGGAPASGIRPRSPQRERMPARTSSLAPVAGHARISPGPTGHGSAHLRSRLRSIRGKSLMPARRKRSTMVGVKPTRARVISKEETLCLARCSTNSPVLAASSPSSSCSSPADCSRGVTVS